MVLMFILIIGTMWEKKKKSKFLHQADESLEILWTHSPFLSQQKQFGMSDWREDFIDILHYLKPPFRFQFFHLIWNKTQIFGFRKIIPKLLSCKWHIIGYN